VVVCVPHSNNIIFMGRVKGLLSEVQHVSQSVIVIQMCDIYDVYMSYLILPWNGHAAGVKLAIEGIVRGIQIDTFHRRELLDVQNIFSVNRTRL